MNFPGNYLPAIIALCKRHKVKKLFAFGSVLTSRFNEQSDIDLVVDFDKTNVDDFFRSRRGDKCNSSLQHECKDV